MKRILIALIALLFLVSCSVQESMSPDSFTQRLCAADGNFAFDESLSFSSGDTYTFYFSYAETNGFAAEIRTDGQGNTEKINLACSCTDKVDLFVECVKSVVEVYSPDENVSEIISSLFDGENQNGKFVYHETQWYLYSAVLSENGLYFSTENKKLSPQSEVELSLKQNDIVEF